MSWNQTLKLVVMKAIIHLVCCMVFAINASAWTPPIGIPAPNWGPTIGNPIETVAPTPPANWTSNMPGIYFVQSGGTNPNEGYPGNPRNAIPRVLPAGTIVFVNGTYNQSHSPYYINHAGTSDKPCWILSYDRDKPAVCTGPWAFTDSAEYPCSYLIIDHISWDWSNGSGSIEIGGGVSHICFRNGSTKGKGISDPQNPKYTDSSSDYNTSAIGIGSSGSLSVNPTEQIVVYNMKIIRGGNWMFADGDPDAHGISVGFPVQDMWFVDNEISYFSGCAIQVGAGSIDSTPDTKACHRMYIGRNLAHHIAQSALWSKRSVDCIMSENIIHSIRRDCPSSPNAGGIGGQYGPRDMWVLFNTIYNCQSGISFASGADNSGGANDTDLYIIGNVLYDIHDKTQPIDDWRGNPHSGGGTAILLRGGLDHYIVNNTIDGYDAGILSPMLAHNRFIEGNILSGRNDTVNGADIILAGDAGGLNRIKSNIIQEGSSGSYVQNGEMIYKSISALNSAKGPGNSKSAPSFLDPVLGNYALAAGSSGVDGFGAAENKVYELFRTKYGRSINVDRGGSVRPTNNTWDVGAFEYNPNGGVVTPSQPGQTHGLRVKNPVSK